MKTVVVSLIVTNGLPKTVTTAAAMPPDPPAAVAISPLDDSVGCVLPVAVTFQRKPIAVSAIHGFAEDSGWV